MGKRPTCHSQRNTDMRPIVAVLLFCFTQIFSTTGEDSGSSSSCDYLADQYNRLFKYCPKPFLWVHYDCTAKDILMQATKDNDYHSVSYLLQYGVPADEEYKSYTPLIYAAQNGFVKVGRLLLQYGANVKHEVTDDRQKQALHYAAEKGHTDFCKLLLEYGADINALDDKRQSPIFYSGYQVHFNTTKLLANEGADLTLKSTSGKNPSENAYTKEIQDWLKSRMH